MGMPPSVAVLTLMDAVSLYPVIIYIPLFTVQSHSICFHFHILSFDYFILFFLSKFHLLPLVPTLPMAVRYSRGSLNEFLSRFLIRPKIDDLSFGLLANLARLIFF